MTEDQIKHMVHRFLGWQLPSNFGPDGGVSFKKYGNEGTPHQYENNPTGTNLLDVDQATEMVKYMLENLPLPLPAKPAATAISDEGVNRLVDDDRLEFLSRNIGDWSEADAYDVIADIIADLKHTHAALAAVPRQPDAPIDMILHCPKCGVQHIDAPEGEGWTNPPHRSHLCHTCATVWRPADVATNGVREIRSHRCAV